MTNMQNVSNSIMLEPTSPTEVNNLITSIKTNVAAGVNDITPLPVKMVSTLSHINNNMLQTGVFPNEFKTVKVSSI